MALYRITVKESASVSGERLEKGMSVEVVDHNNPVGTQSGKDLISEAFESKYGVDIRKTGRLSTTYLEVERMN